MNFMDRVRKVANSKVEAHLFSLVVGRLTEIIMHAYDAIGKSFRLPSLDIQTGKDYLNITFPRGQ